MLASAPSLTEWADAYPGAEYIEESERARAWTESLGELMHEIRIETNAYALDLVCHDLRIDQLAVGDPVTGDLKPIDGV